jgi:spermidine synthase
VIFRPVLVSVFLLSAAALGYEILLMRLFAIIQWHHFAYMVIGLALLGYGVSGTIVSIFQHKLQQRFGLMYVLAVAAFGVTAVAAFRLAQLIPFNAEEILWDGQQLWYLSGLFVLLSVPFFFAATAICLAFQHYKNFTAQIYAADLIGAGLGSIGIVLLLFGLLPQQALLAIGLLGLLAAIMALPELPFKTQRIAFASISLLGLALLASGPQFELRLSPYKSLQQTLRINGANIVQQRSGPMGLLSVVENNLIPFRHAPGMSLNAVHEPPAQLALFTDGESMTAINRFGENPEQLAFLDYLPSALPYHLNELPAVLIVGGGGGSDILQALGYGSTVIDVLELNAQVVELVDEVFGAYSSKPYSQPQVNTHIMEVRDYLGGTSQRFDLIQIALLDAFSASSSGLYALHESYLYTIEALQLYLQHLRPDGYLALTRWINIPPRDSLKMLHSVIVAMRQSGITDPENRLMLLRGWQSGILLIKNGRFTEQEIKRARQFAKQRSFDIAWLPGIHEQEPNRYNKLESAMFYEAASQLLSGNSKAFIDEYKFDLRPATDDRPYFHHFFKWSTFQELFALRDQGGMSLIEWGYLILLASLLIAVASSVVLILLPLWFYYRKQQQHQSVKRLHVVAFFFAIGLAFLMIEIAFMQKFMLFLHHPIYAIATTLTAFLLFAGLGSQSSSVLGELFGRRAVLTVSIAGIVMICLLYLWLLGDVFVAFANTSLTNRILLSVLLIMPLAFVMGMPFPLALASLADFAETYIPWAWGINGCASVISASLATLLAISFGFNLVILAALILYLTVLKTFPSPSSQLATD